MSMKPGARSLIVLNLFGGAAVLASYVLGLGGASGEALWGGVPESLRPLYTVNMFLAAGGYFLFTPYILLRLDPESTRVFGRFGYGFFHVAYALVLIPSALWLPLTASMVEQPTLAMWVCVRLDLMLVALGVVGLLAGLVRLGPKAPRGRGWALLGLLPFALQTVVLDALVWPAFFPLEQTTG
jgi:hypothetical protein